MTTTTNTSKVAFSSVFIAETLKKALSLKASDIHITEGKRPVMRVDGKLIEWKEADTWSELHIRAFLTVLGIPNAFKTSDSVNTSFTLEGQRFRFHGYKSFTGITIALRVIPLEVPKFENLNLPDNLQTLVKRKNGLVLVTGATGSGKSTTLASLINLLNNDPEDTKLVVTVEQPIEFLHQEVNARIVQREVGKNVASYADAVRDAVREDPDVILIGELQDREAIRNAITLSETGHLVLGSLHSNGAAEAFDRILDAFPGDQQQQVRSQLGNSLQGIIHQQLVPKVGGGRVPLIEYLPLDDEDIRRNIRNDSSVENVTKIIKEKFSKGLISNERCAALLIQKGLITLDTAVKYTGARPEEINRTLNSLRN